jgi:hypothetical protein
MASSVLPQPEVPQISVSRPLGNPPPVISSNPWMPVGDLGSCGLDFVMVHYFFFLVILGWDCKPADRLCPAVYSPCI